MNRRRALELILATPAALGGGCQNVFSPKTAVRPRTPPPPPPPIAPQTAQELVELCRLAYAKKDVRVLALLLHPEFAFVLNVPAADGTASWGAAEEARIHRRMFQPESLLTPEPPVDRNLWLTWVDILLTGVTAWDELPVGGGGLVRAAYDAQVMFQTAGGAALRVQARQEFIVKCNRDIPPGEPGRCLLVRWIDHGPLPQALAQGRVSWSAVKQAYGARPL